MDRLNEPLSEYQARPTQSLAEHLSGVVETIQTVGPTSEQTAYGDDWRQVMTMIGWLHDAGKLTTYFQDYLETEDRTVAKTPEHTYHGALGALLCCHALTALDVSKELRMAGFFAVAKHHGVIPELQPEYTNYALQRERAISQFRILGDQLEDIDTSAASAADALLREATDGRLAWEDIHIETPEIYRQYLVSPQRFDEHFYETVLRAWSTLVCADKLDAASITPTTERPAVSELRANVRNIPSGSTPLQTELNKLRTKAHEECHERLLEEHREGAQLFQLTLPTGFGKTLSGLRAALELATERESRVIYALPYTSVLEQVDDECQRFLNVDPQGEAYTIHHHLADTRTTPAEREDAEYVSDGAESLYAETWQAGLILTTFTQLFESVAGPRNVQSMKLPALEDSVILLDEPQGIPLDWWNLVARLARSLIDEYDATVIAMTATQPEIFEWAPNLPTPTPLTNTTDECLDFLQETPRVEFALHDSLTNYLDGSTPATIAPADAASELLDATTGSSNTLAVVNTVNSAATLAEQVSAQGDDVLQFGSQLSAFCQEKSESTASSTNRAKAYLENLAERATVTENTTVVAALTTRIRPCDRSLLLAGLRCILDEETPTPFDDCATITVSTQLIEAGVDISFDRLYRDYAPLPALVQSAGRCNRAFDGGTGAITIWRLANAAEGSPPSSIIYGRKSLLRPSKRALSSLRHEQGDVLTEASVIGAGVSDYYDTLHNQRRTADRDDDLVECFNTGDGDTLRNASLIDDDIETQDVIVLVSEADVEQFERYQHYRQNGEFTAAKRAFKKLKSTIVTVPVAEGESVADNDQLPTVNVLDGDRYDVATGRGVASERIRFDSGW
jgi:CRISPR-associated endonuclease Cas3-HD